MQVGVYADSPAGQLAENGSTWSTSSLNQASMHTHIKLRLFLFIHAYPYRQNPVMQGSRRLYRRHPWIRSQHLMRPVIWWEGDETVDSHFQKRSSRTENELNIHSLFHQHLFTQGESYWTHARRSSGPRVRTSLYARAYTITKPTIRWVSRSQRVSHTGINITYTLLLVQTRQTVEHANVYSFEHIALKSTLLRRRKRCRIHHVTIQRLIPPHTSNAHFIKIVHV